MQWYYCDSTVGINTWHSYQCQNDDDAILYFRLNYYPDIIYTENDDGSFRTIWEKPEVEWTKDKPIQSGYYWAVHPSWPEDPTIVDILVAGTTCEIMYNDCFDILGEEGCPWNDYYFQGPIPFPEKFNGMDKE